MNDLEEKIYSGKRISLAEACDLFSWDLVRLAMAADFRRRLVVPSEEVGFIIDRIINYTNICKAKCRFCAYHARAGIIEPFDLTMDQILARVRDLVSIGGTQVMLQGGVNDEYTLDRYVEMLVAIKSHFPHIYIHSFSPAELWHLAKRSNCSLDEVIHTLKRAGLDSVPGASDLLVDRIRAYACPAKISVKEWCEVMRALARCGLKSSATMTYGMGETLEERVAHLDVIRRIQDETGIIRAFIPWSFSPLRTEMDNIHPASGVDYLKIVAVARIYLDNVVHFQAGWLTEGMKLAQLALSFGANDFGGVLLEEHVIRATGIEVRTNREEIIDIIRNAGKIPCQRDSRYQILQRYE
ncbi:MAG: CofH family radical SAM protein [Spirochaetes bacterium]|nr:CofH family radical SAM protein [Spirochaetota bacterium]